MAATAPVRDAYRRNDTADAIRRVMALADEANRTIEALKPWALAKQPGAEDALLAACTQGLQLFRVLAAGLKPVLPRTCAQAETFLGAPVNTWADIETPLPPGHVIEPYAPLFVRVDPARLSEMVEASREGPAEKETGVRRKARPA